MIAHSKPFLTQQDYDQIHAALKAGRLAKGQACETFVRACADYLKLDNAFSATSGTAALILALRAVGVGTGDEVLLPSYVCGDVQHAIEACGAKPVFYDIGNAWRVDAEKIEARITPASKAIIAVHIYGICNSVGALKSFNLPIIEDACQALTPNHVFEGDVACFSFQATKCLTTGEGGMVSAISDGYRDALAGAAEKHPAYGRLSDMQASLGMSQLAQYDAMLARRKEIAVSYFDRLPEALTETLHSTRAQNMFFRFPLYHAGLGFAQVQAQYAQAGVAVRHGVDTLLHRVAGLPDTAFPSTVDLFQNSFSIPIYPALEQGDITHIIETTRSIFQ